MKKVIMKTVSTKKINGSVTQRFGKSLRYAIFMLILITMSLTGFCESNTYADAMLKNIADFKKDSTLEQYQATANSFERIVNIEKEKWLPSYYAAHVYVIMSFFEEDSDKRDLYIDKAQTFIDNCQKIVKNESEVYVMQGFIHQARISVSPMVRGMKYSVKASEALNKAIKINENNPRAYFLLGQNLLHTPSMFGGGTDAACPYLTKAKAKYKIFKPKSSISPNWGEKTTIKLFEYCNKEKK
ncbi:MAG: hypothetical protein IMY72_00385 [Bacteroidetes bacterium]|nr:hypothetical protein [Bacteroidota bacterium]